MTAELAAGSAVRRSAALRWSTSIPAGRERRLPNLVWRAARSLRAHSASHCAALRRTGQLPMV